MAERTLPLGWAWTTLGTACTVVMGQSPPSESYNTDKVGLPFFQGKAEFGDLYPTPVKWCSQPGKIAEAGDILITVRAPVGPTNLCREKSCIGRGLGAIRPLADAPNKYWLYALRYFEDELAEKATGTTFAAISGDTLRGQKLPLAPLPEQRRIVAKVESLFTRLDASVAALKHAQANLKRYKASVLKAACEGRLVPQDPAAEPAQKLLDRILRDRRAKWEADLIAKGKDPNKAEYEEPKAPDTDGLPELPKGWCWATWEQLSPRVTVGFVGPMKHEYVEAGVPFLRSQNVRENRFDLVGLNYISPSFHQRISKSILHPGDLVVVRSGSVGVTCVIPESLPEANCSDLVVIQKPQDFFPEYGAYYMNSLAKRLVRAGRVGVALIHFNTHSVAAMPVPLPPLSEQRLIVAEAERRLSVIDEMEQTLVHNLARAERLRQAILKKAFDGRLVEQHPEDEPAEKLLERIRGLKAEGEQLTLPAIEREKPGKKAKVVAAKRQARKGKRNGKGA